MEYGSCPATPPSIGSPAGSEGPRWGSGAVSGQGPSCAAACQWCWRRVLPHSRPAATRAATTCIASRSNITATFEIGQRHFRRYRRQYILINIPEHTPAHVSPATTETNNPQRWYGCCDARGREHPSAGKLVGAITRARLTDVNSRRKTPRAFRPCSMYGPLFRTRCPDGHPRDTGWSGC
jgi:hypothetical protein